MTPHGETELALDVLPFAADVLALGGELKNTVCLVRGDRALLSKSHSDLIEPGNYRQFLQTVSAMRTRLGSETCLIAHDLHPNYLSTRHALAQTHRTVAVQHHHAHAVSCAVDAGAALPVIGIVCDGTGYGTDGHQWGGEVLLCEASSFRRFAHLDYFPLPGGDAAARQTWRPALSLLREALPDQWQNVVSPAFACVEPLDRKLVGKQLETGLNAPLTSSLGRLFDAVAALTGICLSNDFEGQAAIALQAAAVDAGEEAYPFQLIENKDSLRIDWREMIRRIIRDVASGLDVGIISGRFHQTVVAMLTGAALRAVAQTGVHRVVLSGGCFFNELLRCGITKRLAARDISVFAHDRVSPGDAGLALGQAVVAASTTIDIADQSPTIAVAGNSTTTEDASCA